MSKSQIRLLVLGLLGVLAISGCSSSGSRTLFFNGHWLLSSANRISREAPLPAPTARELDKSVIPAYFIEPGDQLEIRCEPPPVIPEDPAAAEPAPPPPPLMHIDFLAASQVVLVDGTIDLGKYGRLVVAGRTPEDVEFQIQAIVEAVERRRVEPINVQIVTPGAAVYYVLGEVESPGVFPLTGRETVLDGIIAAGGLNGQASVCKIILDRPTPPGSCRVVLPVCYREIVQLGDTTTNYQLRPGDRVFVPSRNLREAMIMTLWKTKSWGVCNTDQYGCPDPNCTPCGAAFIPLPAIDAVAVPTEVELIPPPQPAVPEGT
jgi:protein involved in polysaccharide export with SLBB domain